MTREHRTDINLTVVRDRYSTTEKPASRKLLIPLNPIFLSRGNSIRRGCDRNFDDGRSKPVIVRFRALVRTGTTLVSWIPVVRWERALAWGGIGGHCPSRRGLRLCV